MLVLVGLGYSSFGQENLADLELFVRQLRDKTESSSPRLPIWNRSKARLNLEVVNNIFAAQRISHYADGSLAEQYSFNQIQMVGYLSYHGIAYAFVHTPFATLQVKSGDRVLSGRVIKITPTELEIDDAVSNDPQLYPAKILLQLKPLNPTLKMPRQ